MRDARVIDINEIRGLLNEVRNRLESLASIRESLKATMHVGSQLEYGWLLSCMDNRKSSLENRATSYMAAIERYETEHEARRLARRHAEVGVLYIDGEAV